MNFTDDELRLILDALSCLDNERNLDSEDFDTMNSARDKIRDHFKSPTRAEQD